jgi:heat shock protein HslJ
MVWLLAACGAGTSRSPASTAQATPVAPTDGAAQETPVAATPAETGTGEAGAGQLEGTEWRLIEYGPADAPIATLPDVSITLMFEAGNKLGGSGGCNSYGGTYQVDGQTLSVSDVVSTMRACEDAALTQQESKYLAALGSATSFQLSGNDLIIDYDGGSLHYSRI